MSEVAGIEPRTVASLALEVRRSNQSARSPPRPDLIHRLDLIPQAKSHLRARSHPQISQIYHYLHGINKEKTKKILVIFIPDSWAPY